MSYTKNSIIVLQTNKNLLTTLFNNFIFFLQIIHLNIYNGKGKDFANTSNVHHSTF